jgi:hypothetical protein
MRRLREAKVTEIISQNKLDKGSKQMQIRQKAKVTQSKTTGEKYSQKNLLRCFVLG